MALLTTAVLVFASVALVASLVLGILFSEERRVRRQLRRLSSYEKEQVGVIEPLATPFGQRVLGPVVAALVRVGRTISPVHYRRRLRARLVAAGHPRGMTIERLMAVKVLALLGVLSMAGAVALGSAVSAGRLLLATLILAPVAFYLPDVWLGRVRSERLGRIRRSLPDMLDMLTISVEAGLGFDQAIAKLVANSEGPLAVEFGRVLREVQAGASRKEALHNLSERVDIPELNSFVMSMIQADVFGVSVSRILRAQAREMRRKRRQLAEETAQKAPVKIVFPLVLCILPATLIVILGPAAVSIGQALGRLGS